MSATRKIPIAVCRPVLSASSSVPHRIIKFNFRDVIRWQAVELNRIIRRLVHRRWEQPQKGCKYSAMHLSSPAKCEPAPGLLPRRSEPDTGQLGSDSQLLCLFL